MNNIFNNESVFACRKLESLYKICQKDKNVNESVLEYFYHLSNDSLLEMIKLRLAHKINDRLMPYFLMSYTKEKGAFFAEQIGEDSINTILAENWFHSFVDNNDAKNEFFMVVPIFTTDLVLRISKALENTKMKTPFYLDLLSYSESFIEEINKGDFYIIFNEQRKSSLGAVEAEEVYFSDLVKNSIELFYYTVQYILNKNNLFDANAKQIKRELLMNIKTYLNLVSPYLYFNKTDLMFLEKNELHNDKDNQPIETAAFTIQGFVATLWNRKKQFIKPNGALECDDGSFRKPINGKNLIIGKKNSSNAFALITLSLILFTILGAFAISYANTAENSYSPMKEHHVNNNDLSSIVQDNLTLNALK